MNESSNAIVIGAGIVGVSTALHLLMRGMKVTLVDRRGAGLETSYGNAGIIGNSYVLPFGFPSLKSIPRILLDRDVAARIAPKNIPHYLTWLLNFYRQSQSKRRRQNGEAIWPLTAHSLDEHRILMRGTTAEQYLSPDGRVALYRSEESFESDAASRSFAKELHVPFDVMDTDSFGALEPYVKPIYRKAVRWTSSWRLKNPGAVVADYAARFVKQGGNFVQAEAERVEPFGDKSWRVMTAQGEICACHVVICTGPWSNDVLKPLGYKFPLAFKRGYHRHYKGTGNALLSHVIVDVDNGYLIAPMEQGYRLVTGAEIARLDDAPTPVQIDRSLPFARELFPLGDPVEEKTWMGNRPCFPNSLPMIGASPKHQGLWFNFGHGHVGMTTGPASGRLLAQLIRGEKPLCDPTPFRAERFT